jgi:transposase-like protein
MRKYDDEFKREAIRKIHDGQSVASVARELGCAESLLHNWKRQAVESSSESEREVLALKKRVHEVEMERDILKKCMAPPSGSRHRTHDVAQGRTDAASVAGFCCVGV